MTSLCEEESLLRDQLKNVCNDRGMETNLQESASIINKLGLLYQSKSPDKISLIRSCALLNAAVIRQPLSVQFREDLLSLCSHVLNLADAKLKESSLVQITENIKSEVSILRDSIRGSVQELSKLSYDVSRDEIRAMELKKIDDIKIIQSFVTKRYTSIMNQISMKCLEVMGEAPCRFALIGMGSLARKEITPYSDFEHAIILEDGIQDSLQYDNMMEYFRWFSVIFQFILVNLKETILRFMAIPSLNDAADPQQDWFYDAHTPCGISPDGFAPSACKNPLGRQQKTKKKPWTVELIKPVSEMLQYLDSKEDLKNGYHLAEMLTKTCFVSGSKALYKDFTDQTKTALHVLNSDADETKRKIGKYLEDFEALFILRIVGSATYCDIKRVVYRSSTLFISVLGTMHNIDEASCFDIVEKLGQKGVIDSSSAHELSYALAVACQVRLNVYMMKNAQDDFVVEKCYYNVHDKNVTIKLIEIIGERSLVDYFYIVFNLQTSVEHLISDGKFEMSATRSTFFIILHTLKLHDRLLGAWDAYLQNKSSGSSLEDELVIRYYVGKAYSLTGQNNKALTMFEWLSNHKPNDSQLEANIVLNLGKCYMAENRNEDAIACLREAKMKFEALSGDDVETRPALSHVMLITGVAYFGLKQPREALNAFREQLSYLTYEGLKLKRIQEFCKAGCFKNMARCLCLLGDYESSLENINKAIYVFKLYKSPAVNLCECYNDSGVIYERQHKHTEAFHAYEREIEEMLKHISSDQHDTNAEIQIAKERLSTKIIKIAYPLRLE